MATHNIPYTAVVITAVTPVGTFTTPEISLDDDNVAIVENILQGTALRSRYRLPVAADEVVILSQAVVAQTVFKIRYIA